MRTFIRHPSDIPIEVYPAQEQGRQGADILNNVSMGGVSFRSDRYIDEGTVIRIKIPLTRPSFEATGRVAWCREDNGSYDVGVAFLDTGGDAFRLKMVEQICHIEHYKREIQSREGRTLTGQEAAMEWISKYARTFEESEATKK